MPDAVVPDPQEVTLADLVRVVWARRYVLLVVFLLTVGLGVAYTVLKTPEYEARATLVALEQQDVVQRWLESRQSAQWVAERLGEPLTSQLGGASTPEEAGAALSALVRVVPAPYAPGRIDRTIHVDVRFTDPVLARDVANSYMESLQVIRPALQNVTESALFQQFYDGQNAQDARRQAHEVALEREYWIVTDFAHVPAAPSSPNVTLNLALSVVLAGMLGLFAVFVAQWVSNYRLAGRAPVVPESPLASPASSSPSSAFRYRGK